MTSRTLPELPAVTSRELSCVNVTAVWNSLSPGSDVTQPARRAGFSGSRNTCMNTNSARGQKGDCRSYSEPKEQDAKQKTEHLDESDIFRRKMCV